MSEPEQDKRRGQRRAGGFWAKFKSEEASGAGAGKGEEGIALKTCEEARPSRTSPPITHTNCERIIKIKSAKKGKLIMALRLL